jgi:gas vesicle protein
VARNIQYPTEEAVMRRMFSFLAGALCGAIVGAVAALLLAPASGLELRQGIRSRMDDLVAEGRQAAEDRRAELQAQLAALKRPVS